MALAINDNWARGERSHRESGLEESVSGGVRRRRGGRDGVRRGRVDVVRERAVEVVHGRGIVLREPPRVVDEELEVVRAWEDVDLCCPELGLRAEQPGGEGEGEGEEGEGMDGALCAWMHPHPRC